MRKIEPSEDFNFHGLPGFPTEDSEYDNIVCTWEMMRPEIANLEHTNVLQTE